MNVELIKKYNVPGPRYTSYPTVPYWEEETYSEAAWLQTVKKSFDESKEEGISLYIHLPFCKQLCTFCGCHKRITKREDVQEPYIDALLKEWDLYINVLGEHPIIKEMHFGGGTPTFFSPANLRRLVEGIFAKAKAADKADFSFEGHPNNTTKEHLQTLYDLGFRRVSFGVQDYDPRVQLAINRVQPFENVKKVHDWAKEIGYTSVGHDLVFGLPFQTADSIRHTIAKTNELRPERIAYYSYAHVPWIKGVGQRGFNDDDLPANDEKRELYILGKQLFEQNEYTEIGMDHFALAGDSLHTAMVEETMHRNFMGYTPYRTNLMIGLGSSSISDSWYGFSQNDKTVESYQATMAAGKFPGFRGHILNEEDLVIRRHVLDMMCHLKTDWKTADRQFDGLEESLAGLTELEKDGLLTIKDDELIVTEEGRPFVRNICMSFDWRMLRNKPQTRIFSMTI